MINILDETTDSLVCIKISGKLTDVEYKAFIPRVESTIKEFGKIKFYIDIIDLDGWEWRVAWDDFAFGIRHWSKFTKIAIVGQRRWERLAVWITNRINNADVRFYDGNETTEALNWVQR